MPDRSFIPTHEPAKWWERVLMHPFENVFALLAGMFSFLAFLASVSHTVTPSKSMDTLPPVLLLVISCVLAAGSVLTLVGLHWPGEKISVGWNLEKLGWAGSLCGLLCYTIVLYAEFPGSVFSWMIPLMFCVGAVLRIVALILIERATRRAIREIKGME